MSDATNPTDEQLAPTDPAESPRMLGGLPEQDSLGELIGRLEGAAEQLRSGELSADAAATLVEECAVLANRAGAELERRLRDSRQAGQSGLVEHAPAPGQEPLL
jgi:hypothetical protein